MPTNSISLSQNSQTVTISSDGSAMTSSGRQILLNESALNKITIDFGDSYKIYLTNFTEANGSSSTANVAGIPVSVDSGYNHTVNIIPGRYYLSGFDIYDANTNQLLGSALRPSQGLQAPRQPAITLNEINGNLVIYNYLSVGFGHNVSAEINTLGTYSFTNGSPYQNIFRTYTLTSYNPVVTTSNTNITNIIIDGQTLTQISVADLSTITKLNNTYLQTLGNLNCLGGADQNTLYSINTLSNLCHDQIAQTNNHAGNVPNQSLIQSCFNNLQLPNGTWAGFNYYYLSDFNNSSNFSIKNFNSNPYTTNVLNIINNKGCTQTVDLSDYQGIVLVNSGVNLTGITALNYVCAAGGGTYNLSAGNQIISLLGPNGIVNGNGGVDTVNMVGVARNAASISQQGNDLTIWCDWLGSGSGLTTLLNVARVQFSDSLIAFDTGVGQNAGSICRLYNAAFNRSGDAQGIGYWLSQLDNNTASLLNIANQFILSTEFSGLYGTNLNNAQFIASLYSNVLGRAPDGAGAAYWEAALNNGASRAQILIDFSESTEGVAHVAAQLAQGVTYQQYIA